MKNKTVSIYNYLDFRKFLKAKLDELRAEPSYFSYRSLNRKAGIKSASFWKLIIDGKRNLGPEGMRKVAKAFGLKSAERHFFFNLVQFNQAKSHAEKDQFFKKLTQNKTFSQVSALTEAQYALFSKWYYAVYQVG